MKIFFELIYNLSILVSISIISGFIGHRGNKDWRRALFHGILFGSAAVIVYPIYFRRLGINPGL